MVRIEKDGTMRTLRTANNGFSCMVMASENICNDANAMEFFHAVMSHTTPPDKLGFSYMLSGDNVGGKLGLTREKDPDPKKPYMMWAGTPYEHAGVYKTVRSPVTESAN